MEWKPDKTSKAELEKRQAEFAAKALEMAKKTKTNIYKTEPEPKITSEKAFEKAEIKPEPKTTSEKAFEKTEIKPEPKTTSEKAFEKAEVKPEPKAMPEKAFEKTEIKPEPKKIIIETPKPEPKHTRENIVKSEHAEEKIPELVGIRRVREAEINAEFDFKAKVYKSKKPETEEEKEPEHIKPEPRENICEDITDNPFGEKEHEVKEKNDDKCPPNFNEYIKKHNEQQCNCEKCKAKQGNGKKKWI